MQSKFITVDGINLAYLDKNSNSDKTIFFIHGNSSSHRTWQKQFNSPLLNDYRLIAFDLPAHGLSDGASEVTDGYSLPGIARLMARAVVRLVAGKPYLLAGFSLGTNIVSEMLAYHIQPAGIILAGSCAISVIDDLQKVFLPNPHSGFLFKDEIDKEGLQKLTRDSFFKHNASNLNKFTEDFVATKAPFRSLLLKSSMEGKIIDEIAALKKMGIPLLIIFGKEEKNVNPDHLDDMDLFLWRDKLFKLKDAGHFAHEDQPEVFNQLFAEYAADRFTPIHS